MEIIDISQEQATLDPRFNGFVATFYENERPLRGLAGSIDWIYHGVVSDYFKQGFITGKKEELVYTPLKKQQRVFHTFLLGCGMNDEPGERIPVSHRALEQVCARIKSLGLENIAISKQDVGDLSKRELEKIFQGASVCLIH